MKNIPEHDEFAVWREDFELDELAEPGLLFDAIEHVALELEIVKGLDLKWRQFAQLAEVGAILKVVEKVVLESLGNEKLKEAGFFLSGARRFDVVFINWLVFWSLLMVQLVIPMIDGNWSRSHR